MHTCTRGVTICTSFRYESAIPNVRSDQSSGERSHVSDIIRLQQLANPTFTDWTKVPIFGLDQNWASGVKAVAAIRQ